jgi:hypothetical protein
MTSPRVIGSSELVLAAAVAVTEILDWRGQRLVPVHE